ncbi:hypothetical protein [Oceanibaculum indicum]|uniref:Hemolysin type calcium-binding protein n=1 Tax=Oceanibaculum indicum TaxID=526216 RepID=A0A420WGM8_9PROT|nr:hypothetical protein [Oceanibaculum indicum]RKQ70109.1 hemolysin type calcium-binding protein [Oceanibaculum indicum]
MGDASQLLYTPSISHPQESITYAVVNDLNALLPTIDSVMAAVDRSSGLEISRIGNGDISTFILLTLDDPNAGAPEGALGYSQTIVDGQDITRVVLGLAEDSPWWVVAHEILHGMGLDHPFGPLGLTMGQYTGQTVMDYHHTVGSVPTGLLPWDKEALRALYGWDQEITGTDIEGAAGADTLTGGDGSDRLQGFKGPDLLIGGAWDDELRGGKGHDTLVGGAGADTLFGGQGNDVFVVDEFDTIADFGEGDVIIQHSDWTLM